MGGNMGLHTCQNYNKTIIHVESYFIYLLTFNSLLICFLLPYLRNLGVNSTKQEIMLNN